MVRKILMLLLLASPTFAQWKAMIDENRRVVSLDPGGQTPAATGTTVVTLTNMSAWTARDEVQDEFGRCVFRVTATGVLQKLATPEWPAATATAFRLPYQARCIRELDDVIAKIIVLERWQADHIAVRDRSAALNALITKRNALLAILDGQ